MCDPAASPHGDDHRHEAAEHCDVLDEMCQLLLPSGTLGDPERVTDDCRRHQNEGEKRARQGR
jgi:hypothetical protein